MRRKLQDQKGAFAPFVGILIILLILAVGLVVDLGHIHNVRIELQRAVDAAALAGAGQLTGDDAQEDRARNAAVAIAAGNTVDSDDPVVIDPIADVEVGFWDDETLGAPAEDRFTAGDTPLNAVRVETTLEVEHFFFFLIPSTTVTADAIAVNAFEEESIPIALISCIPTGGGSLNIGSPGLSICDIATYRFHSDQEDTSAWTSLTFSPANKSTIEDFLTEEGRQLFNEVVYGTNNPSHEGIENTPIETLNREVPVPDDPEYSDFPRGCGDQNDGTDIECGLGEDISLDPESITGIRVVASDHIEPGNDPLEAYLDGLPRWYHFDDDDPGSLDSSTDAFTRMWTMEGNLVADSEATLQTKLADLYFRDDQPFGPDDYRFKHFIECQGGCSDPSKKYTYDYTPKYREALRYAGYPKVYVNNGTIPTALQTFIERIADTDTNTFESSLSTDNEPFQAGNEGSSGGSGNTVKLTIPVIFAGDCETWKALSQKSDEHNLPYVGTASFLVTRAWKNPNCFEQGTNPLTFSVIPPDEGNCTPADFDPPLAPPDNSFECIGGPGANPSAALEGLIRPPARGEDTQVGIRKIYLVE